MTAIYGILTCAALVALVMTAEHLFMRRRAARANRNLWQEGCLLVVAAGLTGAAFAFASMIGESQ